MHCTADGEGNEGLRYCKSNVSVKKILALFTEMVVFLLNPVIFIAVRIVFNFQILQDSEI